MKNFVLILILITFSIITVKADAINANTANCTTSNSLLSVSLHPNMFLNASEITSIKAKIDAGEEPWLEAYNTAIARADLALGQQLQSVRDGGTNTNGTYDGDFSDNRHDYTAAGNMAHAVRDLGIAYAFSEHEDYANKAIELIYHWCINPTSAMKPQFNGNQSWIELTITMPAMFYGADMMWNYDGWDVEQKTAFISWVRDFSALAIVSQAGVPTNNFGDWRLVFLASSAVIIEDESMMSYVVDHYKLLVPGQITNNGRFGWEFNRTEPKNGLFYSTFAMVAVAQVCEIVRHHGTDLYNWEASNGTGSIEKAFDYMAPFVETPSSWSQPSTPIASYTYMGENAAAYELAYSIWQKPEYLQLIQTWGRPMYGSYVQGPLTLTHAFRDITTSSSSVLDDIEYNVTIYPNPASNLFMINFKNEILKSAIVYNQLGQQVKEVNTVEVNISDLPAGIYFVKITSQSGKTTTKKIIKN